MHFRRLIYIYLIGILVSLGSQSAVAQLNRKPNFGQNGNANPNDPFAQNNVDTTDQKKKKSNWDEEAALIYFKNNQSEVKHSIDSGLLFFHRNELTQPVWYTNTGNWASPANNNLFTLNAKPGLRLGYQVWDLYKYTLDSLPYFNTTRPYTSFSFMLGSKQLQWVEFLHTQNINPRWNFAFKIANNVSEGFYRIQKASGVNGFLSSNYKSVNQRYNAKFAFILNNFKNDENGGISDDSLLGNSNYNNRSLIPVNIQSLRSTISPVHNRMTELQLNYEHSYAWGKKDSIYNADSTSLAYSFTPRFSIKHTFHLSNTRHLYVDGLPDSSYYEFINPGIVFGARDTVRSIEQQTSVDNRFSINTFLGKDSNLLHVEAGIGLRYDRFSTDYSPIENKIKDGFLSNYLYAALRKDALKNNQFSYLAGLQFYYTGVAAGNVALDVKLSKSFTKLGLISIGLQQSLFNPSYQQGFFKSTVFEIKNNFGKTTNTQLYGQLWIKALKLELGLRNLLIGNYIYLNDQLAYQQYSSVFSVLQFTGRKTFYWGAWSLDNEVVWQQMAGNAPLNLPSLMLRHQLAYKLPLFKDRLDAYLGIQARYNTPYKADGYSFVYNQFYYQNSTSYKVLPTMSAFFNFKVKRLRLFVMGDQLQQMIDRKSNLITSGYPTPNASFRFGFNWIMMN